MKNYTNKRFKKYILCIRCNCSWNCRSANNTSHSETAQEMEAIITFNGKENEEEQPVNVKIGEANNQHPAVPDENELKEFTVNFSEVI